MNEVVAYPFRKISLADFLSTSQSGFEIALEPLNVIVGPNGSGKSNIIEAFSLLRATPRDLHSVIRRGGGVNSWLWQGPPRADSASITIEYSLQAYTDYEQFEYELIFRSIKDRFYIDIEELKETFPSRVRVVTRDPTGMRLAARDIGVREVEPADIEPSQSVLSQWREPDLYPEMSRLAELLSSIRIYRNFPFGPDSILHFGCRSDVRTDFLEENLDNLPARLAAIKRDPAKKRRLLELLQDLAPGFNDIEIVPEGGALQLYLIEGERSIPAHRLSDGTLRYLCLLAILLDPGPTSLLVIEEPELGLHPDVVVSVTKLMIEASSRTQLLVTTHSSQMLDALTEHADSVLVCEKPDNETTITRLRQADIDALKDRGGLGWLWMRGHIGGTRW